VVSYARVQDREGFTNQLRVPRKTLETERRILVLLRNAIAANTPAMIDLTPALKRKVGL